jgi:hypothetical protein
MINIPIKTDNIIFYRQFLELIRSIPPLNKLRSREIEIFSQILYYNNMYKNLDESSRTILIFSKENRKLMREYLNIDENVFNNNIYSLKKANIISKDYKLNSLFKNLFFEDNFQLKFEFINTEKK